MMKIKNVDEIRKDFPIFRHRSYIDTACYAPGYKKCVEAMNDFNNSLLLMPCASFDQTLAWLKPVGYLREEICKLINADDEEIAFITSTGMGNNKIASSLNFKKGDNIIINDLEFPSAVLAFNAYQRQGVEIRIVKHQNGSLNIDDFEALMDNRTRLIAISSVQWASGFRIDLKKLVELAEAYGAYVAVDTCQSLGAMKLDVKDTGIHFMATQGHKWMFSPFGTGILYVRKDIISKYDPMIVESVNLYKNPKRQPYHHQFDLDIMKDYAIEFVKTAAKFQSCNNICGLWGMYESVKTINHYGIENIEERIHYLVDYLLSQLTKVDNLKVLSQSEKKNRSGIVMATYGSVEKDTAVMKELSTLGVGVSCRYQARFGGLRFSLHFYNDESDIDRLISALRGETKPIYFH